MLNNDEAIAISVRLLYQTRDSLIEGFTSGPFPPEIYEIEESVRNLQKLCTHSTTITSETSSYKACAYCKKVFDTGIVHEPPKLIMTQNGGI